MRNRVFIIIAAAVLVIGTLAVLWRVTHPARKKIVILKRPAVKEVVKRKELPQIQKKFSNPKVAIVIDDFGYNMYDLDKLFSIRKPVTFSVLPDLPYSKRIAELAKSKGYEVILHMPLESNYKKAAEEKNTIKTTMNEQEVAVKLADGIACVPGLDGVSNHQGSRATEDKSIMTMIMKELKKRNLYYFDSLVTYKSVCRDAAREAGIPYAKRDLFLDNVATEPYISKQVLALRRFAFRKGSAIAVCHDRKNTIAVLSKMMPLLADDGIVFVSLSDMVK